MDWKTLREEKLAKALRRAMDALIAVWERSTEKRIKGIAAVASMDIEKIIKP